MLVRLLVAVLMLAGPTPVRVCTCATAGLPETANASAPASPPERAKGCGCGHRPAGRELLPSADVSVGHEHAGSPAGTPDRHHPKCPAVNPPPVVSAVLTPAADLPADLGVGLLVHVERPAPDRPRPSLQSCLECGRPPVPLYLLLLSLRI